MITYTKKAGSTDVSVVIRIVDSTDGTPETAVTAATGGLDLQYRREGATSTTFTEADLTNLNDAHSDYGMKHIGNGYYRLDLPDAAVAAGSTGVLVHGTATGMIVIGCYIDLVAYDPYDTVRLGLTALPNVATGNAGAVITSGTGTAQLSVTSGVASAALTAAGVDAVWDEAVDGSYTAREMARIIMATLGGQASGLGTTTALYKNRDGTKTRITATVDADGNRTAVTFTDIT